MNNPFDIITSVRRLADNMLNQTRPDDMQSQLGSANMIRAMLDMFEHQYKERWAALPPRTKEDFNREP